MPDAEHRPGLRIRARHVLEAGAVLLSQVPAVAIWAGVRKAGYQFSFVEIAVTHGTMLAFLGVPAAVIIDAVAKGWNLEVAWRAYHKAQHISPTSKGNSLPPPNHQA